MNYVEFANGHKEEIIWMRKHDISMRVMSDTCIEFITTSGHYVYEARIMNARGGIKYLAPWFAEVTVDHCALGPRCRFRECDHIIAIHIKEEPK